MAKGNTNTDDATATVEDQTTALVADPAVPVAEVRRMKRVVIQRPPGNTDTHIHLGFNSTEGHYPFDEEIELPADMVDYLRSQKRAEFHPDEQGRPVVSYSNILAIMDA